MQNGKSILISGAGPAGLAMAIGLKNSPFTIALTDKKARPDLEVLENDRRMIALSKRSFYFLQSLGVWEALAPYASPIEKVHVSQKGFNTVTILDSAEHRLDNFGYLIPMGRMIMALHQEIEAQSNVVYMPNTELEQFRPDPTTNKAECHFRGDTDKIKHLFDWVISAEGMNSQLRNLAGIQTFYSDYNQVAVIATGRFEHPHHNVAYERFTSNGPIALLPIADREMAIVLVVPKEEKPQWLTATAARYADEVNFRMAFELGEVQDISERDVWDLRLMIPKKLVANKLTLIGNSAHSLHPIAGQGLNLGFRDCEELIPYFKEGHIPAISDLARYERARRRDIHRVVGATDFLVRAFDLSCFPLPHLRDMALKGVKLISPLRRKIARFGMGL